MTAESSSMVNVTSSSSAGSVASKDASDVLMMAMDGDVSSSPIIVSSKLVNPVLRIGIQCGDIYPVVEVDLIHNQEKQASSNHDHPSSELGTEAAMNLHQFLVSQFQGRDDSSRFILLARILVVSDGRDQAKSSRRSFWQSSSLSKNKNMMNRPASLEVSYCVFERESGKVAIVERKEFKKYSKNDDNNNDNRRTQPVIDLTSVCGRAIQKEIIASTQQNPLPRRMPSLAPPTATTPATTTIFSSGIESTCSESTSSSSSSVSESPEPTATATSRRKKRTYLIARKKRYATKSC